MTTMDDTLILILAVMILGATSLAALVNAGYINTADAGKYMIWGLLGLGAIAIFVAPRTRSKTDDYIASFLFITSIGGFIATYLIDNGYVTAGYLILMGISFLGLLLLIVWNKSVAPKIFMLETVKNKSK